MQLPPFDMPDEVFIDPETGYAVNIPLGYQGYPGWQHDHPEVIRRIRSLRRRLGIIVDEDFFIENPVAGRPSDLLQDYIEQHGIDELAQELSARVQEAFAHMKATHGRIIKRRLPTSRRPPAEGHHADKGPLVVEPISIEESNRIFEELFEQIVFVDGPDEELPTLDPEDDDEPE